MTDTTLEAVDRFSPYAVDGGCDAYGKMEEDDFGDWVRFEDYAALHTRAEAAEADLKDAEETCDSIARDCERRIKEVMSKDYKSFISEHTRANIAEAERDALAAKLALAVRKLEYILDGMAIEGPEYLILDDYDLSDAANEDWVRETLVVLGDARATLIADTPKEYKP